MRTIELGERRRKILEVIVNDYVETAEPVGSEMLVRKYSFGVKSATIRNEMAAMSEMGYLRQPHTSAGRVPSDMGYRYYVDQIMPRTTLGLEDTNLAQQSCDPLICEVEELLQRTCSILSGLTKYMSLVTAPQIDTTSIRQIALLSVAHGKLLVVIVLSTGHVDHRPLDYSGELQPSDAVAMGNLINDRFQGVDANDIAAKTAEELPGNLQHLGQLYERIAALLKQALTATSQNELFMDGTAHILKEPEFVRSGKLASVLDALEHRRELFQTLSTAILGQEVTVFIGMENQFEGLKDCSFVASSYSVAGRTCGSIGVIGPTRMDYRRAVAAVQFMASNLSHLLTSLSLD
jgi:heat-inducible transcriptional repressor